MTFIGDSELIVPIKVIKRTAKFVTVQYHNEIVRCGVTVYNNVETIYPSGRYSMAPSCDADDLYND